MFRWAPAAECGTALSSERLSFIFMYDPPVDVLSRATRNDVSQTEVLAYRTRRCDAEMSKSQQAATAPYVPCTAAHLALGMRQACPTAPVRVFLVQQCENKRQAHIHDGRPGSHDTANQSADTVAPRCYGYRRYWAPPWRFMF
ncbi:hypothetical protein CBL_05270 [Carabus blaptoides fortunei]